MTKKESDSILFAWLATFFTIIGFLIGILSKKEDKYAMFYAKQGVVLFLFSIGAGILSWIPFIGWIFWALTIVIWALAWINALSGEKRNTWIIGDLANKIKL